MAAIPLAMIKAQILNFATLLPSAEVANSSSLTALSTLPKGDAEIR